VGVALRGYSFYLLARFYQMGKKLFVGNLPWKFRWQDLKDLFKQHGEVVFARVVRDRETGKSRGFGFVEFENEEDAAKAKEALNGAEVEGRTIRVDDAQERPAEQSAEEGGEDTAEAA